MATGISILIQSIGWTLLHSLWQGAITAAVLWLILRLLPNIPARIRYHLSLSSFTFLFSWFLLTAFQQYQKLQTAIVTVTEANNANIPVKTYTVTANPSDTYTEHLLRPFFSNIEPSFTWIVTIYLCGILFMLARMAFSFRNVKSLKTKGILPASPLLQQQLDILIQKLELTRNITLKLSNQIQSPMMMGFLKPIILLPFSIVNQLTPNQLEAILIHELAHIKRQDYIINIFQTIVETLLFFNPFMWRISNIIRREREHCCDDIVLSLTNNPLPYATALATLETIRINAPQTALAAAGKKQHLFIRIKRIMEMKKTSFSYNRQTAAVLLIAALGIGAIYLTPSFAQSSKKKEVKQTSVTTTTQWIGSEKLTVVEPTGLSHTYETLEELPEAERLKLAKESLKTGMRTFYGSQNKEIVLNDDGKTTSIKIRGNDAPYAADLSGLESLPDTITGVPTKQIRQIVLHSLNAVPWDSVQHSVSIAIDELKGINWDSINKEINSGLKEAQIQLNNADLKKEISKQVRISKIENKEELDKLKEDLNKAIAKVNDPELRQKLEDELRNGPVMQLRIGDSSMAAYKQGKPIVIKLNDSSKTVNKSTTNTDIKFDGNGVISDGSTDPMAFSKMVQQMAKEGLIEQTDANITSQPKTYTIEKKGENLYINGKKQSAEVYNRYKQYLGEKDVTFKTSIQVK